MSPAPDPSIDALLAAARAQFASGLPAKTANVEELVARGAWDEARRAAHRLRGSAGTYGFVDVGAAAGAVEELLLASAGNPDGDARARLGDQLHRLVELAARAQGAAP
jgi:HPt (histidine-containing phosphotransfer) domain-containing protein